MQPLMINWRQPRMLAIIAILGMMVAAGWASIAYVAVTGGGVAGGGVASGNGSQTPASSGAPAGVVSHGGDSPGSPGRYAACGPVDRPAPVSHRAGSSRRLVPSGATELLLCSYQGMDPPKGGAEFQLIGTDVVRHSKAVEQLADGLNALKPTTGSYNCPMDDGSMIVAYFRYPSGVDDPVLLGTRGCQAITNGHVSRLGLDKPVVRQLIGLVKPIHTQVATFNGRIRLCGGPAPGRCRVEDYQSADHVEALTTAGVYLGEGAVHHGRFRFKVAVAGDYTLKLMKINTIEWKTTATARLGHTTAVTLTIPVP